MNSVCPFETLTPLTPVSVCPFETQTALFQQIAYARLSHTYITTPIGQTMEQTQWTHNPTEGSVIGCLTSKPIILDWAKSLTVTAMMMDSSKRQWRIRANTDTATKLLACDIGDRIKLTGIKGDLCIGAWDNAKRQIVPHLIELMERIEADALIS